MQAACLPRASSLQTPICSRRHFVGWRRINHITADNEDCAPTPQTPHCFWLKSHCDPSRPFAACCSSAVCVTLHRQEVHSSSPWEGNHPVNENTCLCADFSITAAWLPKPECLQPAMRKLAGIGIQTMGGGFQKNGTLYFLLSATTSDGSHRTAATATT
jgi:hypothetical protein